MSEVSQEYWKRVWRCVQCKFILPFKKVKNSDIDCTDINDTWMKCRKCGNEMKRTAMKEVK